MPTRSVEVWLYCPRCHGTRKESWPVKEYVFLNNPSLWFKCERCERQTPWDHWLVVGGDWDITLAGPVGRLPKLGEVIGVLAHGPVAEAAAWQKQNMGASPEDGEKLGGKSGAKTEVPSL